MPRSLVIIHGWSDNSESFEALSNSASRDNVEQIFLADYVSMDDLVTIEDVACALEKAWKKRGLPREARSVDVIVHSTGALVIREWMLRFCLELKVPRPIPIYRLVMLAPANFGSPLAHLGRSMIARVLSGLQGGQSMQTGTQILKALELASPYTWKLAERDVLKPNLFGVGNVLCTVLVGTAGYSGSIRSAANTPGSDGTVYVSTANLNCQRIQMDFAKDPKKPELNAPEMGHQAIAFARIPGENHDTIRKGTEVNNAFTTMFLENALRVTDETFGEHWANLNRQSEVWRAEEAGALYTQGFQNTVIHVVDNLDYDVKDYFIELFCKVGDGAKDDVDNELTGQVQESIIQSVHPYKDNPSYRKVYMISTDALSDCSWSLPPGLFH